MRGTSATGIFEIVKTTIEGNELVSDTLTVRIEGAKHHFAGEGGQAAGALPVRGILQLSKLVIRHPEVYQAASNLLHEMMIPYL